MCVWLFHLKVKAGGARVGAIKDKQLNDENFMFVWNDKRVDGRWVAVKTECLGSLLKYYKPWSWRWKNNRYMAVVAGRKGELSLNGNVLELEGRGGEMGLVIYKVFIR